MKNSGLYIHVPFCASKCPYCDFYSAKADEEGMDRYVLALCEEIKRKSEEYPFSADTIYFGGGTPSLLGAKRLNRILDEICKYFTPAENAEITVECNPSSVDPKFFNDIACSGFNRISMGLQSFVDRERKILGRRGSGKDVLKRVEEARKASIENISLDLMLGIPNQTPESFSESLNACIDSGVPHISGYMLKLEEGTPFYKMQDKLLLPDEDAVCDMYIQMCETFEKAGINQYEVSNFAVKGMESKHNLKYWRCEEYFGIGPSAHSFMNGKRFFYPRDTEKFIISPETVQDGNGGDFEEYAMLALRLKAGLKESETLSRFGFGIPKEVYEAAEKFKKFQLVEINEEGINLTPKGFLLSNTVISELIL